MAVKFPSESATSHTQALPALLKVGGRDGGRGWREEGPSPHQGEVRSAQGGGLKGHMGRPVAVTISLPSIHTMNSSHMGWPVRGDSSSDRAKVEVKSIGYVLGGELTGPVGLDEGLDLAGEGN